MHTADEVSRARVVLEQIIDGLNNSNHAAEVAAVTCLRALAQPPASARADDLTSSSYFGLYGWAEETAELLCDLAEQTEALARDKKLIPEGFRKETGAVVEACMNVWRAESLLRHAVSAQSKPLAERLAQFHEEV